LCVFSSKTSGKTSSVYEYFLQQNYGLSESAVKDGTADLNVRYKKKGLKKYYDYIQGRIASGTLSEADIFDDIASEVLEKSEMDMTSQMEIENKSVEYVILPSEFTKNDITKCSADAKAALAACEASADPDMKKKIAENCLLYESELMKLASISKAEVMKKSNALETALVQRLSAGVDNAKRALELKNQMSDLKEKENAQAITDQAIELQSQRTELVTSLANMDKASASYKTKNNSVCDIDKKLKDLLGSWTPADNYGCDALEKKAWIKITFASTPTTTKNAWKFFDADGGSAMCDTATFTDPEEGVAKACYLPDGTKTVNEGASITLPECSAFPCTFSTGYKYTEGADGVYDKAEPPAKTATAPPPAAGANANADPDENEDDEEGED
jgi:hypothetical protein